MTIGKKLTVSFAAMLVVTLALGISSVRSMGTLSERFDLTVNETAKKVFLSDAVSNARSDMFAAQRGVVVFTYGKRDDWVEKSKGSFEMAAQRWTESMSTLRKMIDGDEGKALLNELDTGLQTWRTMFAELNQVCAAGNPDAAVQIFVTKGVPLYQAIGKNTERLAKLEMHQLEEDRMAAADAYSLSRWIAFGLIALSVSLGTAILAVVRRTSRTLQKAAGEIGEGAEQISNAASQVATSSQALAQGASQQAASLEETSASTEQITSMTRKTAGNASSAAEVMASVDREVKEGNHTLELMVLSMQEINASSDKISKIIKVIDEIAFQTNILALNAAVEAARAGEAGMGFAVVADEVRNLAQRSAQAAKDTSALIEESIATSRDGSAKLEQVAGVIRAITESSNKVKMLVDEVNIGGQEQARGIAQISRAVSQMDQVTQGTAASAEESASASEELSAQAQALNKIVVELGALVGAGR